MSCTIRTAWVLRSTQYSYLKCRPTSLSVLNIKYTAYGSSSFASLPSCNNTETTSKESLLITTYQLRNKWPVPKTHIPIITDDCIQSKSKVRSNLQTNHSVTTNIITNISATNLTKLSLQSISKHLQTLETLSNKTKHAKYACTQINAKSFAASMWSTNRPAPPFQDFNCTS